jgi:hypothetical protein
MAQSIYTPAAIGLGVPTFIALDADWARALLVLGITTAVIAVFLAACGFWLAHHHTNQIFDEEIGGRSPNNGLGPKDFAMDLRIQPVTRIDDTDTGETR